MENLKHENDPVHQYKGEGPWTMKQRRDAVENDWPLLTIAIDDRHMKGEKPLGMQKLLIHARGAMHPDIGRIVRRLLEAFTIDHATTTERVLEVLDEVIARGKSLGTCTCGTGRGCLLH
jgi:hypothetical protein